MVPQRPHGQLRLGARDFGDDDAFAKNSLDVARSTGGRGRLGQLHVRALGLIARVNSRLRVREVGSQALGNLRGRGQVNVPLARLDSYGGHENDVKNFFLPTQNLAFRDQSIECVNNKSQMSEKKKKAKMCSSKEGYQILHLWRY